MKMNMGNIDRIIRILIAVVILILWFANVISGTFGVVLLAVSVIFIITAILGVCPAYMLAGFSTKKNEQIN